MRMMHIVVSPVMNVGVEKGVFPFMHVTLYKNKKKWKQHLVNYTFGVMNEQKTIDYDSELGELKSQLFAHLNPVPTGRVNLCYYRTGGIAKKILRDLKEAPDGRPLLFVWDKSLSEENPFYHALGVNPSSCTNLATKMMTLEELGLKIKLPFLEHELS